eukprot:scaffold44969_cov81-Attheya_sp.AAC.1
MQTVFRGSSRSPPEIQRNLLQLLRSYCTRFIIVLADEFDLGALTTSDVSSTNKSALLRTLIDLMGSAMKLPYAF